MTQMKAVGSILLLAGCFCICFISAQRFPEEHRPVASSGNGLTSLGDRFPDSLITLDGSEHHLRELVSGAWSFLIFRSELNDEDLEYPSILAARYRDRHLRVFYLLPDSIENRSLAARHKPSDGAVGILLERRKDLHRSLGIPNAPYVASYLVDPAGAIQFALPHPAILGESSMRQLTERYILGHALLPDVHDLPGYRTGAPIPEVAIANLRTSSKLFLSDLATPGATVIFFRANCTTCGPGPFIQQLVQLQRSGFDFVRQRTYFVFSRGFRRSQIIQQLNTADPHASISWYHAGTYVDGWEDAYYVGLDALNPPRVIRISPHGTVAGAADYRTWIAEQFSHIGEK